MFKKTILIYLIFFICLPFASASEPTIQSFLIRNNYLQAGGKGIYKANKYKRNTYTDIRPTSFMGLSVLLHKKVHASLKCVEKRINNACPNAYSIDTKSGGLSGWRPKNTFHNSEISNHLFGIALDIDPHRNPCCGCVKHWAKVDRCNGELVVKHASGANTGHYDLPQCWIDAFRANGWYWLGDDRELRDTMHFEFLGNPNKKTICK